jgi:predicted acetyltransferase
VSEILPTGRINGNTTGACKHCIAARPFDNPPAMSFQLRWVGKEDLDRVAETRMRCYAHAGREIEKYKLQIRENPTARPGDFLIAEQDGQAVGTATSLSMTMWVRGAAVACQGVASVGTIKTHRRRRAGSEGVATQIMWEALRRAREREQVVSALMPFRATFYEHFGYGLVERRCEWTAPLSILPTGDFEGMRFYRDDDLPELVRFRQRIVERGQCDIERPDDVWKYWLKARCEAGFVVIDRPLAGGPVHGYLAFEHQQMGTKDFLRVMQMSYDDIAALRRQLHFLSSLRDQYLTAVMLLPADLPLNWMLRETQLPHRLVNHPHAEARLDTRMQLRVLDHKRFLEALTLPTDSRGSITIAVIESEGHESRFRVEISEGRAVVAKSDATPEFTCPDRVWAAIACGDLAASRAVQLGLASATDLRQAEFLDVLGKGPLPFSHEYF